ncbi:White-opaque regulator [Lachnellula subtilissima]|uniref:White-opaque regulator n=1 Tax=Lachnellula subtilissima TaxID=602034 RepID=A0A8H8RVJ7_9HELO|nr:White-opaque regulator [Lachnellula subtilissima]
MVYCGKPSRGCQMCRTRRIKCDETKPTCLQCQKSRRQCPGYKDEFDLVFRNETQATEKRARKTLHTQRQGILDDNKADLANSFGDDSNMHDTSSSRLAMMLSKSQALSVPIEQQAPCFFVTNFIIPLSDRGTGTGPGHFDYLEPLMKTTGPNSTLSVAFKAVAMAALANRPNSRGRGLLPKAMGQYAKALKATNLALQNPAQQKTDQTLASILMLGFFETILAQSNSAQAWYSHVDGAVQVVRMRGKKQLRTKIGRSMFRVVRNQMTVNCMTASKVPAGGADWWCTDSPGEDFIVRLNIAVATLRSEIHAALADWPRTPEYFQKATEFIRRARIMEKQYLQWEALLPEYLKPKTIAWVDQIPGGDITRAEVCPGKVDVYQDIRIATMWNHTRILRLYISGTIVRCAAWIRSPLDYRTAPEYSTESRLCHDLITETIASIPFFLGWRVGQGGGGSPAGEQPNGAARFKNFFSPSGAAAFFAIWPLFSISTTDSITDLQRAWVKGRLVFISEVIGLSHAKVLSGFQLRLPSMTIRRDNMGHAAPTPEMLAAAVTRGVYTYAPSNSSSSASNPPTDENTTSQSQSQSPFNPAKFASPGSGIFQSNNNNGVANLGQGMGMGQPLYTLNPLQQRQAMQKEAYERERASLLKKASNSQGDAVEKLAAKFLAV